MPPTTDYRLPTTDYRVELKTEPSQAVTDLAALRREEARVPFYDSKVSRRSGSRMVRDHDREGVPTRANLTIRRLLPCDDIILPRIETIYRDVTKHCQHFVQAVFAKESCSFNDVHFVIY